MAGDDGAVGAAKGQVVAFTFDHLGSCTDAGCDHEDGARGFTGWPTVLGVIDCALALEEFQERFAFALAERLFFIYVVLVLGARCVELVRGDDVGAPRHAVRAGGESVGNSPGWGRLSQFLYQFLARCVDLFVGCCHAHQLVPYFPAVFFVGECAGVLVNDGERSPRVLVGFRQLNHHSLPRGELGAAEEDLAQLGEGLDIAGAEDFGESMPGQAVGLPDQGDPLPVDSAQRAHDIHGHQSKDRASRDHVPLTIPVDNSQVVDVSTKMLWITSDGKAEEVGGDLAIACTGIRIIGKNK